MNVIRGFCQKYLNWICKVWNRKNIMIIDVNELREDMKRDCYGAYFGGGFGGALPDGII